MIKKIFFIIGCCIFISIPVYAHLTGVFVDMMDENSIELLKEQLSETKREIEELGPEVKLHEEDFKMKIKEFEPAFVFYQTKGMDAYFKTLNLSNSLIELLTFQSLAKKKLDEDFKQLERLYSEYLPLRVRHDTLMSYQELLDVLGENLKKRETILNSLGGNPSTEEVSEKVSEIWTQNIGYLLELSEDGEAIHENIHNIVEQASKDSSYRLEESSINQFTALDYFIRSDHVYVNLKREEANLILIARFIKEDMNIRLDVEAGFINGFLVPEELLEILKGFSIDYSIIEAESEDFYLEQTNGALYIQPVEILKD
ncbi:hypothetical protein QUF73_21615 [Cytobacillus sp. NJ13]|nr:hypothetical protein [Cytobacillus sp. NJ13]